MTATTTMSEAPNDELSLHGYAELAYLEYAIATVKGRALAQVEDGLKPVQRRLLFTMNQLGLKEDSKPVKCARIVGDVLGKYHPHGDQAAYDALVRIAQDFSLRYPLIEGQGNFGSRDGDPAAAMRYTESRLSAISRLLLDELDLGTVDFVDNYDGSFKEPSRLPDRLPFVLLNGSMGIAVGMAANIPSHNLREVASAASLVVSNPKTTLDDVLTHIAGPDYPDGGHIISSADDIRSAYTTGRGSLRVRGRYEREELARGQWQLVFHELPYQVSPKMVLEELDGLTNPEIPKNKKTLTPQQIVLKQLGLDLMERANDESGKDHRVRLVITPRNSKVSQDELLAYLFANTSVEATAPVNLTLVGLDGRPQTQGLLTILQEWAEFRMTTVRRRTEFQLANAEKRIHILDGRMTTFLNLDAVIKVIRVSDEPRAGLIEQFSLSEVQADDILEMRLRQLNRLEGFKLEKELEELRKLSSKLKTLLDSEKLMRKLIVDEITADAAKYGDDRRTLIREEARSKSSNAVVRSVVDEAVTVVLSKNLWVRSRPGHDVDSTSLTYRAGDSEWVLLKTRTGNSIALVDSNGRSYSVRVGDIPGGRGDGVPLTTLIDLQDGAKVLYALVAGEDDLHWFAGQAGYGLVAPFKSLLASKRAGKAFLTLDEKEAPLPPVRLEENSTAYCVSDDGRLLVFPVSEVKTLASGGRGVKLMELGEARLSHFGVFDGTRLYVTTEVKDKPVQSKLAGDELQKYSLHRARKGYQLPKKGTVLSVTPTTTATE